jgi:hypothetical protein
VEFFQDSDGEKGFFDRDLAGLGVGVSIRA